MNLKNIITFLLLIVIATTSLKSQTVNEDVVRKELEKRGVDMDEVEKRLIARGFDPNNVNPNNVAEIQLLQTETEKIIQEIKAEAAQTKGIPKVIAESINESEKVKDTLITVVETIETLEKAKSEKTKDAIYGHHLYRDGAIRYYKKSEYFNTPEDYILGPGDQVTVSIWGRSEANFSQKISEGGFVKFDRVSRIALAGLKLKSARELIKSKLSRTIQFNKDEFELTVNATRNINVFITGEVRQVGSFNMSAVNTAINALAVSGGPSDIGSVRNIKIVSGSEGNKVLDLYKFLQDPKSTRDLYLFEGDYIVVPVAGKVVSIKGAINRPHKYELKGNEALSDLIDFAGGLKVNALRKNIRITRYENDQLVILNADLSVGGTYGNFSLKDGDIVEIGEIRQKIDNEVYVEGAIDNPGTFAIENSMKLSQLLPKLVLRDDAIMDIAYITRLNDDGVTLNWQLIDIQEAILNKNGDKDIQLKQGDRIIIRGKSKFVETNSFEIKGAVNSAGQYQLDNKGQLKVSDAIFLAGGLTPGSTDFGYIIRNVPGGISPSYISINLKGLLGNPISKDNIDIEPGDIIQVYSNNQYTDNTFVSIEGAVRNPSSLNYDKSLTLKDVILLAKGLKLEAATNNIDIFRLEFNNNKKTRTLVAKASVDNDLNIIGGDIALRPFDHIVVRRAPEFELQQEVYIDGEVRFPGKYYLLHDNYSIVDLIKDAGGLTNEAFVAGTTLRRSKDEIGYIVIELEKAMAKSTNPSNVILERNDIISIPRSHNLVSIQGAVNKGDVFNTNLATSGKINFVYEGEKSAKYYIDKSGGFLENADKSSVSVRYPNGKVKRTKRFLFWNIYPKVPAGSIVNVSYKVQEINESGEKESIDWGKVLSNSIAQATTILSLLLLIQAID